MFSKKSNPTSAPKASRGNLSQYGLFDVPDLDSLGNANEEDDDVDDDADLEAELLSMLPDSKPKPKKPRSQAVPNVQNLDKMIAASLKDISDSEISSGDEEDPDLVAELGGLVSDEDDDSAPTVQSDKPTASPQQSSYDSLLKERLQMYETAQQKAKIDSDSSKLRRIDRGIRTIQDLKRQVAAGKPISEDDIPPPISTGSKPAVPAVVNDDSQKSVPSEPEKTTEVEIVPPVPPRTRKSIAAESPIVDLPEKLAKTDDVNDAESTISMLLQRQQQYKLAAVEAKRSGNMEAALGYVKVVKQFDVAVETIKSGTPFDLSSIPSYPPTALRTESQTASSAQTPKQENEKQTSVETPSTVVKEESDGPKVIAEPKTVLEALEQRLAKYKEMQAAAKEENNDRKSRQMGRIADQYVEAIKLHKRGKPIDIESLPTPFGYPQIPGATTESKPAPAVPAADQVQKPSLPPPAVSTDVVKRDKSGAITRNEKQTKQLEEKQKQFKIAAVKAKQNGNMEAAKEYLKKAKQIQTLIDSSICGLPVDMNSIPITPGESSVLAADSEVVTLNSSILGTDKEVFEKLITDLQTQLDMCTKTRDHYKAIGDIANANRFEHSALRSKKDLTILQLACAQNLAVPKFHYETKPFSIVQCNTDLTDNEVQVSIVQGISYNVPNPKEIDTYVKLTFPYPTETPQTYKTSTIYNTNNPAYDATNSFSIQRNVRACQRIFKRQNVKCEVWSKGGFFKGDTLIGTVNVKLQPLETQCTIHDALDLMDGRKIVGGKLEVKVRARNPILKQQVEHVEQKWLLIDV